MRSLRLMLVLPAMLAFVLLSGGLETHAPEIPRDGENGPAVVRLSLLAAVEHGTGTSAETEEGCGTSCSSTVAGPVATSGLLVLAVGLLVLSLRSRIRVIAPPLAFAPLAPPPR